MANAIDVVPGVSVPADSIEIVAVRSSGPGGQNVNKVASKVEVHVDLNGILGLSAAALARLHRLAAGRLDAQGRLLVTSQRTRDQARNIEDAISKIRDLISRAMIPPKPRIPTRRTRGSIERRLADKKHRAQTRRSRGGSDW